LVTEYGIAINPARTDLIERFKDSNLPIYTIEELQQLAFDLVGKPQDIPLIYNHILLYRYYNFMNAQIFTHSIIFN
ncbi:Citrate lyase, alpha subunit, partial [human gut metagenome]